MVQLENIKPAIKASHRRPDRRTASNSALDVINRPLTSAGCSLRVGRLWSGYPVGVQGGNVQVDDRVQVRCVHVSRR